MLYKSDSFPMRMTVDQLVSNIWSSYYKKTGDEFDLEHKDIIIDSIFEDLSNKGIQ